MTIKALQYLRGINPEQFVEFARTRTLIFVLLASLAACALFATANHLQDLTLAALAPAASAQPVALAETGVEAVTQEEPPPVANKKIEALAGFLARKYRVSPNVTQNLVSTAYAEGARAGVDPLLIIAVMAVESSFNPIAESVAGAKGLMQVIPRYHPEKFAAAGLADAALDPETNIQVGARILKEYIQQAGGLVAGLQRYNGAPGDTGTAYANKVIGEQQRLKQVVKRARTDA